MADLCRKCIAFSKALMFKMAIAVAPVTNWRFDSIYTRRFVKLQRENASGYDDN
jgi:dipeptidyl-peptidase-4